MGLGVSRSVPSSPGERSPSDKFPEDPAATPPGPPPRPATDNSNKVSSSQTGSLVPIIVTSCCFKYKQLKLQDYAFLPFLSQSELIWLWLIPEGAPISRTYYLSALINYIILQSLNSTVYLPDTHIRSFKYETFLMYINTTHFEFNSQLGLCFGFGWLFFYLVFASDCCMLDMSKLERCIEIWRTYLLSWNMNKERYFLILWSGFWLLIIIFELLPTHNIRVSS